MEYRKIEKDNYNLHIINTDRFKAVNVCVNFTSEFSEKDLSYNNLLLGCLCYSSKKYNTKNKMAKRVEELYGSSVFASGSILGNLINVAISTEFLNPIYTDIEYYKESLDNFFEILFNPNVENKAFFKEHFDIVKRDSITALESIKDNSASYGSFRNKELLNKNTPLAYNSKGSVKEIKKITPESLYKYYLNLFNGKYKIDIVVLGQINDIVIDLFDKRFKNVKQNKKELNIFCKPSIQDEKDIVEKLPFNQSILYNDYRLIDLDDHEYNHILKLYNAILGAMSDSLLFVEVREKNSLCYTINSFTNRYNPTLVIRAKINKKNYDKTLEVIDNCMKLMRDRKTVESYIEKARNSVVTMLNNYYDDSYAQMDHYYFSEFDDIENVEDMKEAIRKVTVDEVLMLNIKIKKALTYFLKGDN